MWDSYQKGAGMRDQDTPPSLHPPTPTPFLQTLRLVTVLFYRINDTKLDVSIEIQEPNRVLYNIKQ